MGLLVMPGRLRLNPRPETCQVPGEHLPKQR